MATGSVEGPIWPLRFVLDGGTWKVDPFSERTEWIEVGRFTIDAAEPPLSN